MKTLISTVLLFCTLTAACQSTEALIKNDDLCEFNYHLLEKEKKINPKAYDSILNKKSSFIKNDKLYEIRITKYPKGYEFLYGYKQTNKQTNIGKWIDYFPSGNIYSVQFVYEKGFQYIGKETHYDTLGNISKVIDHRQADKYPICYREALEIVERIKPKKDSILSIERGEVEFIDNDSLYTWSVYVDKPNTHVDFYMYSIHAKTGEILKKKDLHNIHQEGIYIEPDYFKKWYDSIQPFFKDD
ncbi:PepSY domain-containing protein, partial [Aquimarina longa]|uniref:PepSY domain-containing protein n=1 Tax=Aquimarina longa TaxID=1080221 RepID=UPI000A5512D1